MLVDNRTARLGHDSGAELAQLLQELGQTQTGLTGTGYDAGDLESLLAELSRAGTAGAGAAGDAFEPTPPPPGQTRCQPGDIWVIDGRHRVAIGDSTDALVVERSQQTVREGWAKRFREMKLLAKKTKTS